MKRLILCLFLASTSMFVLCTQAVAQTLWQEGRHFARIAPVQKTSVPAGKIEVLEVFSYGCPACNSFQPIIETLRKSLPADAQMAFLPASFKPSESWPMFQRAFYTAQSLGIAERAHQAMYDAVWKTGELAVVDPVTHRLKNPQPTIEDAAKWYERITGVASDKFLAAARSFGIDTKVRAADAQVIAMQIPATPCIVVNGKYRIEMESLSSAEELIGVVRYLIAKEHGAGK
jgi:thiol:disulfide interchange protein DsbA